MLTSLLRPRPPTARQALAPTLANVDCYKVDVDDAEELAQINDIQVRLKVTMVVGSEHSC